MSFVKSYRPKNLDEFFCGEEIKKSAEYVIKKKISPVLITGRTGFGKTTLARIIGRGIEENNIVEHNAASDRGINFIRNLVESTKYMPFSHHRVIILDEVQKLTSDAVSVLLKPLEEDSVINIWILCSDKPEELPTTIKNRCYNINLEPLTLENSVALLEHVCKEEKISVNKKILQKIPELGNFEARLMIQLLEIIHQNPDWKLGKVWSTLETKSLNEQIFKFIFAYCKSKKEKCVQILLEQSDLTGFVGDIICMVRSFVLQSYNVTARSSFIEQKMFQKIQVLENYDEKLKKLYAKLVELTNYSLDNVLVKLNEE
jgi:DNA polymerase III gamma/tau subunit